MFNPCENREINETDAKYLWIRILPGFRTVCTFDKATHAHLIVQ
jgi:hypothetical protein